MSKLIVGGRYVWTVVQAGKVKAGAGGSYTVEGEEYTENVVFTVAENQQAMVGKSFNFSWKIEDGKWYHKGTLKIGNNAQEIDEIWSASPDGVAPDRALARRPAGTATRGCLHRNRVGKVRDHAV